MSTVLFVGGGSVGHIAPSVAVWRELVQIEPNTTAHFVCADRTDDTAFLAAESLPHTAFAAPKLSPLFVLKIWPALKRAKQIIRDIQPDVVFSKGGYVSVPVCLAAKSAGIPIILHESDAVSGRANQAVAQWAQTICYGLTADVEPDDNHVITGNPVRASVTGGDRERGLQVTGLTGSKPILLIIGGSQGAQALNDAVTSQIDQLLNMVEIMHITGRGKATAIKQPGYWQQEFVTAELADLYACADIALSRASAGAIGELAANRIATMLCPLRDVGHDHQQHNAEALAAKNAALVIQQKQLDVELVPTLSELLQNNKKKADLAANLNLIHQPDAAGQIARIIVKTLAS